ncbi:MAG: hypothetical protein RB191_19355 [Terriglobia bacterium]|nr:hypothetical protein [Terriglobia bacterium]
MAKKLTSRHPMAGLPQNELMSESTAQAQLDSAMDKALVAADKAKNRAKTVYGRRVVSMCRTDLVRLQKLLRRWEGYVQDAL